MKSEYGDSPLIGASRHGHVATCQLLIDRGATIEFRHNVSKVTCCVYTVTHVHYLYTKIFS